MLESGTKPREIANLLDMSYASVCRFKVQYDEARLNNKINELVDLSKVELENALNAVPIEAAKELTKGIGGLQRLQEEFQHTAHILNGRLLSFIANADCAGDLLVISNILCDLNNTFFNKNSTQVNIQNNYNEGESKYKEFLSDVPTE